MKILSMAAVFLAGSLVAVTADDSSVNSAFQTAKSAVGPASQNKVVSLYGVGTPDAIHTWYIIFYDPTVSSHGRAVIVKNGAVTKTYDANGGMTYSGKLAFDPSRITSEQPVLNAAQNYALKHNIAYDGVRALLHETRANRPFRWRIQLMDAGTSQGYVYINALDDTVAYYQAPHRGGSGTGSVSQDAEDFGNDVQKTFLGIGGDLQQFFTGERTVDQ
jgi:hypothetical protein